MSGSHQFVTCSYGESKIVNLIAEQRKGMREAASVNLTKDRDLTAEAETYIFRL